MLKSLRLPLFLLAVSIALSLTACESASVPASVTGYNHSKINSIAIYSVNGAPGANINEESGGGHSSCCVSIPDKWRPGLTAEIKWVYDSEQTDPNPPPPSQTRIVDIPEYKKPGTFHVHFYDNHQVKVVISKCSIEHPFYPMSAQE